MLHEKCEELLAVLQSFPRATIQLNRIKKQVISDLRLFMKALQSMTARVEATWATMSFLRASSVDNKLQDAKASTGESDASQDFPGQKALPDAIAGIPDRDSAVQVRLAVQSIIDDAELDVREFFGAGVFVCCPQCGADVSSLKGFQSIDDEHERIYVGAQCTSCDWQVASEV